MSLFSGKTRSKHETVDMKRKNREKIEKIKRE